MLSLPKILLTLLVIVAVIVATRFFRGPATRKVAKRNKKRKKATPAKAATTMELAECPVCGVFKDGNAGACERADCPA